MQRLQIVFHGTKRLQAKSILKEGFRAGTYFATHLEDPLAFGGNYVFEVAYPSEKIAEGAWQFVINQRLSPENIVKLVHYRTTEILFENKELFRKIFESNKNPIYILRSRKLRIGSLINYKGKKWLLV